MEYALKLSNVCKQYDSSEFALDKVTFSLPVGTVMGFVGENGAGKTTTHCGRAFADCRRNRTYK